MTPLDFILLTLGTSFAAGLLGSLLGLGGGVIVVPSLTLLLGVDIRYAIGASVVSIIATSSGAGAAYVKERLTNLRVSMLLELPTCLGALSGAYLVGVVNQRWLYIIFGSLMAYTAVTMWRRRKGAKTPQDRPDRLADWLTLHGSYYDQALDQERPYRVRRTPAGLGLSYLGGIVSGLLGIGGGAIKVPTMSLVMGTPMKVATTTSNFMIGITAAASAGVFFTRGDIEPAIAGPVAIGVLLGALVGSRLLNRMRSSVLRIIFTALLVLIAVQMLLRGIQIS